MNSILIDEFERSWNFVHSMTMDFINVVPDLRWDFSPHPRYGNFSRQIRHLVRVQRTYIRSFLSREYNIQEEHYSCYSGNSSRLALTEALLENNKNLKQLLASLRLEDISKFKVTLQPMNITLGFSEYCTMIIQHESIHHGQWCFYATIGGFDTPKSWKKNWNL